MKLILYEKYKDSLDSLVPGSLSLKSSFSHNSIIYHVCALSQISESPHIISSYPTFDQAKEAISQITLAMDKI
jgi:hypothetical protein